MSHTHSPLYSVFYIAKKNYLFLTETMAMVTSNEGPFCLTTLFLSISDSLAFLHRNVKMPLDISKYHMKELYV
jgi:hypothetical protein